MVVFLNVINMLTFVTGKQYVIKEAGIFLCMKMN